MILFLMVMLDINFPFDALAANNNDHMQHLVTDYYKIKNALIKGDSKTATEGGKDFVISFNALDKTELDRLLVNKIIIDAEKIATSKSIDSQRKYFASFSDNLYQLVKKSKTKGEVIYRFHCPMKDAYWLSNKSAVQNPYYGSQMLTCGKLTETIKY